MPWSVGKTKSCPASRPWGVVTKGSGRVVGCHASREAAVKQMAALYVRLDKGAIKDGEDVTPAEWEEMMAVATEPDR